MNFKNYSTTNSYQNFNEANHIGAYSHGYSSINRGEVESLIGFVVTANEKLEEKISKLERKIDKILINTLPKEERNKILIKSRCEKVADAIQASMKNIENYDLCDFVSLIDELFDSPMIIRFLNVCNYYNKQDGTLGCLVKACEKYMHKDFKPNEEFTDKQIISNLRKLKQCGKRTALVGLKVYREAKKMIKQNDEAKDSLVSIMKNSNIKELEKLEKKYGIK